MKIILRIILFVAWVVIGAYIANQAGYLNMVLYYLGSLIYVVYQALRN